MNGVEPSSAGIEAAVIGGSAGAFMALKGLLPALSRTLRVPVIIVVHLPPDRPSALAEIFHREGELSVREAEDKEKLVPGTVYFAPPGYHLLVERDRSLALSSDPPVLFSRPSIDVLFESAADVFGPHLLGLVLSGANQDGAEGLRAIEAAGGTVVVQAPGSAEAEAMPRAALAACRSARALSLEELAALLRTLDGSEITPGEHATGEADAQHRQVPPRR